MTGIACRCMQVSNADAGTVFKEIGCWESCMMKHVVPPFLPSLDHEGSSLNLLSSKQVKTRGKAGQ